MKQMPGMKRSGIVVVPLNVESESPGGWQFDQLQYRRHIVGTRSLFRKNRTGSWHTPATSTAITVMKPMPVPGGMLRDLINHEEPRKTRKLTEVEKRKVVTTL